MRINREKLLQQLGTMQAGLSTRETVEQSSCFVFKDGRVYTYNDEIACQQDAPLLKFTGAVPAAPLLSLLQKMTEDFVDVRLSKDKSQIIIKGKRKRAGIRADKTLSLPIENVEVPGEWRPLLEGFVEAVQIVGQCAGTDESQFVLTCIHIHPKWVEACDNYQITRYRLETGVEIPFLVTQAALKYIAASDMIEISETENWAHFRNVDGMILSTRRYVEEYPDFTKVLKSKGEPTVLPKGLAAAAEKAMVFSAEHIETDRIAIRLEPGKVSLRGEGPHGWYRETKKATYNGPAISFFVSPKLLIKLIEQHNQCEVAARRLIVRGDHFKYVACLQEQE